MYASLMYHPSRNRCMSRPVNLCIRVVDSRTHNTHLYENCTTASTARNAAYSALLTRFLSIHGARSLISFFVSCIPWKVISPRITTLTCDSRDSNLTWPAYAVQRSCPSRLCSRETSRCTISFHLIFFLILVSDQRSVWFVIFDKDYIFRVNAERNSSVGRQTLQKRVLSNHFFLFFVFSLFFKFQRVD